MEDSRKVNETEGKLHSIFFLKFYVKLNLVCNT